MDEKKATASRNLHHMFCAELACLSEACTDPDRFLALFTPALQARPSDERRPPLPPAGPARRRARRVAATKALSSSTTMAALTRGDVPAPRISKERKKLLMRWLEENWTCPYPTAEEYERLAEECELPVSRIRNWFINIRGRYWRAKNNALASKGVAAFKSYLKGRPGSVSDWIGRRGEP